MMSTGQRPGNASSFHKKARIKKGQIPGTKPSLFNNQLLISTGIPSLDSVIGGGLAVGTVFLVEEDTYGSYAKLVLKYFMAEAVLTKQSLFLAGADDDPRNLVKELPGPLDESPTSSSTAKTTTTKNPEAEPTGNESGEKMKIAWRYQSQPKVQVTPSSGVQFGHYYDLTKTMGSEAIDATNISYASSPQSNLCRERSEKMNPTYQKLLSEIKDHIQEGGYSTSQQSENRSILRIGIQSLGSPLWGEMGGLNANGEGFDPSLAQFFIALRGILRSALASAIITVPSHLFPDQAYVRRMENLSDTVMRLESFAGSEKEKNPVFKDYHGLLHLVKLPRLNSLVPPVHFELSDLAFKLRRKKFTIEKLHLPPELSDTTGRSQDDDGSLLSRSSSIGTGCGGSTKPSKLDF